MNRYKTRPRLARQRKRRLFGFRAGKLSDSAFGPVCTANAFLKDIGVYQKSISHKFNRLPKAAIYIIGLSHDPSPARLVGSFSLNG
ncbi:protein of unknown function (plasmid) [Caballeronia sp. S22]